MVDHLQHVHWFVGGCGFFFYAIMGTRTGMLLDDPKGPVVQDPEAVEENVPVFKEIDSWSFQDQSI